MTLRKPCIHTLYDGHVIDQWPRAGSRWCDGGAFLTEDAETVELVGESMRSTLAQIVDISLEPSQFVTALDELAVAALDALRRISH